MSKEIAIAGVESKDRHSGRLGPTRWTLWFATVVMALTLVAITIDRRKVKTGELLVQATDASTHVVVRQGERVVIASTDRRSFTLLPGEYEVDFMGDGLHLESTARIAVVRSARAVVTEPIHASP